MSPSFLFKFAVVAALSLPSIFALPFTHDKRDGGLKIVLGNDDGWAEANMRQFYYDLSAAGNDVIVSAPATNKSGTGSIDVPATVLASAGEYNSIPAGAPAEGSDASDPRLNYVNSYPVTAVKYGIKTVAPNYFGSSKPDFILAGPNVGANLGLINLLSGTVGVASEGAQEGIPSIAFSAAGNDFHSYTGLVDGDASHVYSQLSVKILDTLVASGAPYLPKNTFLNVNYGKPTANCTTADKYSFVFSKAYSAWLGPSCGQYPVPDESSAQMSTECLATISPLTSIKTGPTMQVQQAVMAKFAPILSCYTGPSSPLGDVGSLLAELQSVL